jgi:hypothetical protein
MELFIHVVLGFIFGFALGKFAGKLAASFFRRRRDAKKKGAHWEQLEGRTHRGAVEDMSKSEAARELERQLYADPVDSFADSQRSMLDGHDPLDAIYAPSVNMVETRAEMADRQAMEQEKFGGKKN